MMLSYLFTVHTLYNYYNYMCLTMFKGRKYKIVFLLYIYIRFYPFIYTGLMVYLIDLLPELRYTVCMLC